MDVTICTLVFSLYMRRKGGIFICKLQSSEQVFKEQVQILLFYHLDITFVLRDVVKG